jgi:L-ascorbate metabolism protein UlaG (beta-lactamase superfamily)
MKIRWLGHSCFLLTADDGTKIVTDPFNETVGYLPPTVSADYITVSHDHFDHNSVRSIDGKPKIVKTAGEHKTGKHKVTGIESFHDSSMGAKRGPNLIFLFEIDGLRLVHLGDLGHHLTEKQVEEIGRVDILLIPVGGTYTIDGAEAVEVVHQLNPKLVIPMHFKTDVLAIPLAPVDDFLKAARLLHRKLGPSTEVLPGNLPLKTEITVLAYA